MFRHILFSILFFALAPISAAAQQVEILPGYSDFRAPGPVVTDQPMQLIQDWAMGFPESGEGRPLLEIRSEIVAPGRLVIEITESNLADDSVSAVQRRYELSETESWQWELTGYGHRQRCYRGQTTDWQATPCL